MLNTPEVIGFITLAGILSGTAVKLWGRDNHDDIYEEMDKLVKDRDAKCSSHQMKMADIEQRLMKGVQDIAVHDSMFKQIQETLHDIKRSQEGIVNLLTGRPGRAYNGEKE
jgi:hypothetical protein